MKKFSTMTAAASLCLAALGMGPATAIAQSEKAISIVHFQLLRAGWDITTIDAFAMMRFGCLEGLTTINADQELLPLLAEEWKRTGELEWMFTLRQGVKFQNGSPLDANAVVNALNHVLGAEVPPVSFNPSLVAMVEAVDDMTVRVTTTAPNTQLPMYMATPYAGILSPAAYADGKSDPFGTCTGPFTLVSEVAGQSFTLERNPDYWGETPKLDRVQVSMVASADTRATIIRGAQADLVFELPFAAAASLGNVDGLQLFTKPLPRHLSMLMNTTSEPLDNPAVRRAIQMSLNLDMLSRGFYEGLVEPATGPFAPGQPWKSQSLLEALPYDLEGAKALLADAGVDPSQYTLDLMVPNEYQEYLDNSLFLQQSLKDLGFLSTIRLAPGASLEADRSAGNFSITPMSRNILSVVADPIGFLSNDFTCEGSFNISRVCDPALDNMIEAAGELEDTAERYQAYAAIEDYIVENALQLYLAHVQQIDVGTSRVVGYEIHPLNYQIVTTELDVTQ